MEYSNTIDGLDIEIDYLYDPGEPMVWTEPNGDPGTPGCGPSIEILAVYTILKDKNNNEVTVDILPIWDYDIDTLEEEILESYE